MNLCIGEVIAVKGIKIIIKVYEQSNHDVIFYKGQTYQGVSINEHLAIQRGFKDIIAKVEGEYLDESRTESEDNKVTYLRKVELQPLAHFEGVEFFEGVKYLPMIGDKVFLLNEEQVASIYSRGEGDFCIGKTVKEEIAISLPWQHLFNSHIGVFGNTGSGKSNTLTKLYTELFSRIDTSLEGIKKQSQFVLLDFNGEYTAGQLVGIKHKKVIELNTRSPESDKVQISQKSFWSAEVLGLLFKATENTQKPFLSRVINGRKVFGDSVEALNNYLQLTFKRIFVSTSQKREALDLIKSVLSFVQEKEEVLNLLSTISWHNNYSIFVAPGAYFDGNESDYNNFFGAVSITFPSNIDAFKKLQIRCYLQLINDLLRGFVQYDHIQPLIKRMESSTNDLSKVIDIQEVSAEESKLLTVISLRQCNQDIKKIIPLLLTLNYYEAHKEKIKDQPTVENTLHLIIDEAHNILSQQSSREAESWKDYRLELFEEIIKEGRKFGVFLTLSSQRPADISPTIMSQIHNFFIHRLVNDKDLFLIDNTISTLDAFSKNMIPKLPRGCCVVTGTTFDLPLLIQVDKMPDKQRPDSDDIDLASLWKSKDDNSQGQSYD